MTVYLTQQPRPAGDGWLPDLSSASKYGDIAYVFPSDTKVFATPGPSLFQARKALRNFDAEKDFLLWPNSGDPAAIYACLIALGELNLSQIKFLYWDRKRNLDGTRDKRAGFYVPCIFELKEKRNAITA